MDLQLEAMPRDLAGTYERYITQSPVPDHLRQFLVWLAFSKCELKIGELADAVTVDFLTGGLPSYDQDLRYFAHADMLEMCAGFITTTKYGTFSSGLWICILIEQLHRDSEAGAYVHQGFPSLKQHQS